MERSLCLDELSLKANMAGKAYVDYINTPVSPDLFDLTLDLTADGFAFKNHLGYGREALGAPDLFYSGASVGLADPFTLGASVVESEYTYLRSAADPPYYISGSPEAFFLQFYKHKITLGAGFSMTAGDIFLGPGLFSGGMMGDNALARFYDASSGNVRIGPVFFMQPYVNGAAVTTTSLWTFAAGDTIEVSGYSIMNTWDFG